MEKQQQRRKTYYLGQHIRYFKGKEFSNEENWKHAFDYANSVIKIAIAQQQAVYSPALVTVPLAIGWGTDESPESRKIYTDLNNAVINELRKTTEIVWLMPFNWFKSSGCVAEVKDAVKHGEKVIRVEIFIDLGIEVDLREYYCNMIQYTNKSYNPETIEEMIIWNKILTGEN